MNQTILTNAFAIYKAQCEAYNRPIVMDEFVFAMVPEQQYGEPIDLDEPLPPDSQIVGRFPVSQKGMLNPDAVIYSILLGTDIGTWDFNWIGLVNRERNLVGVITHTATQTKVKASPENGIEGDTLTRNIVTPYTNAATLTQINVSAETWQLDFNQRLLAMDERARQQNLDSYGIAAFIGDGWKVTPIEGALAITAGCGYVHGLHCENSAQQVVSLAGEVLPKTLYLVASFKGSLNSAWETHTQLRFADALPNVSEANGVTQYAQAIARVHSPSHIEDVRPRTWREVHLDDSTDPHPQYNKRDASEGETGALAIATQQEVDDA
ncbi:MAG: phage tail protein, partial [Shewanella sp.]